MLQPDGKINVAGFLDGEIQVTRLNPDGSLDSTFGSGGIATISLITDGNVAGPVGLVLQPNGEIVAGVNTYDNLGNPPGLDLVRLNPDGSMDSTFGSGGIVTTLPGATSYFVLSSLALQSDGKIVAAGSSNPDDFSSQSFALLRYNADGSPDSTFGTGGMVTTAFTTGFSFTTADAFDAINSIAIQSDGRIVAVGNAYSDSADFSTSENDFAIARYNPDGSLDTSFGNGGQVLTNFGSQDSYANSVAIQIDGQIVAAGTTFNPATNFDFALVRYQGGLLVNPTTIPTQLQSIITSEQQNGSGNSITLQAASNDEVSAAVSAINSLTLDTTKPITITLDLGGASTSLTTPISARAESRST